MKNCFSTIGLIGKADHQLSQVSMNAVLTYLQQKGCQVLVDTRVAPELTGRDFSAADIDEIGERADLAIVVGGDGNMLGAARVLAKYQVGVVGINRGNLGFLTDLHPDKFDAQLDAIFAGDYKTEERFLLDVEVVRQGQFQGCHLAMNEAVLHHTQVAHMIEFEVYIDEKFVFSQRSDGLIVATPTGSTAYSLSGGGSILTPGLDAINLVPMFPHTLSSRPLVVDANSRICLKISADNDSNLQLSCDSHVGLDTLPGDEIRLSKSRHRLSLVHPLDYDYFNVLRSKLNWGSKLY